MMNSSVDETAISASGLVVRRGRNEILHEVSLSLPRGSVTGLLGPSGCGKTTLMRTLMGVQHITAGSATLLGLPAGHPRLRRKVAYTSQAVSIYSDASLMANTIYFARLLGAGRDSARRAIDRVQLNGLERRRIDQLSGGQASRASLACALVGDPEVLILDEPTVGLDPLTRQALWILFRDLAEQGTTLLVSSHVMDEATRCDSVLFMRDGRFLAYEPVADLQRRTGTSSPEDAFVALIEVARIIAQLKGDPRAIALILLVPPLLLTLLYYVFCDLPTPPGQPHVFDTTGPIMLAVLPMFMMFIVTSVIMLRERASGTLERIFTTPLTRLNLLVSYACVFGLLAVLQSSILVALLLGPLGIELTGPAWALLLLSFLGAVIGVAFGLLASAFARTEFQAVQFMPVFIAPQVFLCGLLVPKEQLPDALETIASWLPMTWAVDVVRDVLANPELGSDSWWRFAALAGVIFAALLIAAASMPRKTR